jgi:hypothetical protein
VALEQQVAKSHAQMEIAKLVVAVEPVLLDLERMVAQELTQIS